MQVNFCVTKSEAMAIYRRVSHLFVSELEEKKESVE